MSTSRHAVRCKRTGEGIGMLMDGGECICPSASECRLHPSMTFEHGKSYPIDTLPDDLLDETIPNRDRWSLKGAMFWNPCQGWWHEGSIADYWLGTRLGHVARFWSPEPPDPMTRAEILAERGEVVCEACDHAVTPGAPHRCNPSEGLLRERQKQAVADAATEKA